MRAELWFVQAQRRRNFLVNLSGLACSRECRVEHRATEELLKPRAVQACFRIRHGDHYPPAPVASLRFSELV